jgi:hypothetical protein
MANKENMTAKIKMPLYLQYYIKYRFLNGGNSCDGVNYFSRFVSKCLSVRPKDLQENRLDRSNEDFEFILPHLDGKNPLYYNYISEENNDLLITAMEYIFYETLFMFMDSSCKYDVLENNKIKIRYGERKKTIKYFCVHSGIPVWAINIETINRLYSRHIVRYKSQIVNNKQLDIDF